MKRKENKPNMFGNKKNNLLPRPHPPLAERILEDISNAGKDDIVFRLATEEESRGDIMHYPMNTHDTESVYKKLKTYLSVKESLQELSVSLRAENQLLQNSDLEMKKMAEGIRRQAQEALVKQ